MISFLFYKDFWIQRPAPLFVPTQTPSVECHLCSDLFDLRDSARHLVTIEEASTTQKCYNFRTNNSEG